MTPKLEVKVAANALAAVNRSSPHDVSTYSAERVPNLRLGLVAGLQNTPSTWAFHPGDNFVTQPSRELRVRQAVSKVGTLIVEE